jgi:hypothetical protein
MGEEHDKRGRRVTTGGQKEFNYSQHDEDRIQSTDTESTEEFKRSYDLHRFYQHPEDLALREDMRERNQFFELQIDVRDADDEPVRADVELQYKRRTGYETFIERSGSALNFELPANTYKITARTTKWWFFTSEVTETVALNQDRDVKVRFD